MAGNEFFQAKPLIRLEKKLLGLNRLAVLGNTYLLSGYRIRIAS